MASRPAFSFYEIEPWLTYTYYLNAIKFEQSLKCAAQGSIFFTKGLNLKCQKLEFKCQPYAKSIFGFNKQFYKCLNCQWF